MTTTGLKVKLLGNHSHIHGGCSAVWEMMRRETTRQGASIVEKGNYDVLVVNGEGSMHHGATNFRRKMDALSEAVKSGTPAFLINTVWQENPHDYDNTLQALNGVVVREPLSQAALLAHGVEARVKPDLSWYFHDDASGDVSDLKNAAVVTDFFSRDFEHFARPTGGALAAYPYFDFCAYGWIGAIEALKTASLLITGRQHAVYAACRARTPFLAVKGSSHKVEGLFTMAGVDIPLLDFPHEIPAALASIDSHNAEFNKLFDWLEAQPLKGAFPDFTTMAIPA